MTIVNRAGAVVTDHHLQRLLRAARRASGNLSQKEAAGLADISEVYWQKIESGAQQSAPVHTLAAMCTAVKISSDRLRSEGYAEIADAVDALNQTAAPEPDAEDHLAATPGATDEEISALQAVWRAMRAGRTAEPYGPEIQRTRRAPGQDT